MPQYQYDLLVVGGGSGGVRAARMAGLRGARVCLVEAAAMGGTCVNVGCIPKKLYSYAAHYADDFRDAAGFGWDVPEPHLDWKRLKANRAQEVARLNRVYEQLLHTANVHVERGWARLAGPHDVLIRTAGGEHRRTARHILLATGGTASVPLLPGRQHVLTSDSMFDLDPFPARLLVVGGGYIACEFASIFNGLGSRVTLLYRGEQVLRGFDDDVRRCISTEMRRHGIDLRTGMEVRSVEQARNGWNVALGDGNRLHCDAVLFATGRVPNVGGLGLDTIGVAQGPGGAIQVDEHYRTSIPSIFAVGDVTARMQLTPVALGEAMVVVDHLFGNGERTLGYDFVPTAVFTHPNIGTVGFTEAEARRQFGKVRIFRSEFKALKHTLSGRSERSLVKLIVNAANDRVVGLHMVGPDAGEVVQGFAVAMKAGATKAVFDSTVGIHPTLAEEFVTLREPVPD